MDMSMELLRLHECVKKSMIAETDSMVDTRLHQVLEPVSLFLHYSIYDHAVSMKLNIPLTSFFHLVFNTSFLAYQSA